MLQIHAPQNKSFRYAFFHTKICNIPTAEYRHITFSQLDFIAILMCKDLSLITVNFDRLPFRTINLVSRETLITLKYRIVEKT